MFFKIILFFILLVFSLNAENSNIFIMVNSDDIKGLSEAISKNNDLVNAKDEKNNTLLLIAIKNNKEEITTFLLEKRASVNISNVEGETPLLIAVFNNDMKLAEGLIKNGADVNKSSNQKISPLMVAIKKNSYDLVKLLVDNGANPNKIDINNKSGYDYAIAENNKQILKYLFENAGFFGNDSSLMRDTSDLFDRNMPLVLNAKYDFYNINLSIPLIELNTSNVVVINNIRRRRNSMVEEYAKKEGEIFYAAFSGNIELFNKSNISKNIESKEGITLFQYAILNKKINVANFLLEKVDNITKDNNAIIYAVDLGLYNLVDNYISKISSSNVLETLLIKLYDSNELAILFKRSDYKMIQSFLDKDLENILYKNNRSIIGDACLYSNLKMLKYLSEKGLDMNKEIYFQGDLTTALNIAIDNNLYDQVKYLVETGVKVNYGNNSKLIPPIMLAIEANNIEIVKLLLSNRAEINFVYNYRTDDNQNIEMTPIKLAEYYNYSEIVNLLKDIQ